MDSEISMTGEISLKGDILKVGGIKEKTIACIRNKIKTLYLPDENLYDTTWIENDIKNNIEFVPINNYKEIYDRLFK